MLQSAQLRDNERQRQVAQPDEEDDTLAQVIAIARPVDFTPSHGPRTHTPAAPGVSPGGVDASPLAAPSGPQAAAPGSSSTAIAVLPSLRAVYEDITAREFTFRRRFFHVIHGEPVLYPDDIIAAAYHGLIFLAIIVSTIAFIVESDPSYYDPTGSASGFFMIETIVVIIFSVDIVLQFASSTELSQILQYQMVIDIASVAGYYINQIFHVSDNSMSGLAFVILRLIRLSRVLRLLKLSSAVQSMRLVSKTLMKSRDGLIMLVMLIGVIVVFCSSLLYFIELQYSEFDSQLKEVFRANGDLSPFQSVPETFWFIIVTITTTGYGDVTPYSIPGRAVTTCFMLIGVLLLSLPNIMIGGQFETIHGATLRDRARRQFGKYFRLVRMVVRFIKMWREFRIRGHLLVYKPKENDTTQLRLQGGEVSLVEKRLVNFLFRPYEYLDRCNFQLSEACLVGGRLHEFAAGPDFPGELYIWKPTAPLQLKPRGMLTVLELMQRMLHAFSGCATADELFESISLYPVRPRSVVRRSYVVTLLLHAANARLIQLYVVDRSDDSMLARFTKAGWAALRAYPEPPVTCPCFRSIRETNAIWRATCGKGDVMALDVPLEDDGYPQWRVAESMVPWRDPTSFVYNAKLKSNKKNLVLHLGGRPMYEIVRYSELVRETRSAISDVPPTAACSGCPMCIHCMTRDIPLDVVLEGGDAAQGPEGRLVAFAQSADLNALEAQAAFLRGWIDIIRALRGLPGSDAEAEMEAGRAAPSQAV